ncbi:Alpha/Beta hydrolase protein [Pavlovales sp. CCMP2436]|nr:Alpha/Beta hydrolase protein [Pavlovales sp. CCMP2436]|mmetsp:Transcript_21283/g.53973  ORF Transcript_21283/g.53973 Transcript_21283/m.53973 type:complete len:376 (+) Transcript_21283:56-1183(+)
MARRARTTRPFFALTALAMASALQRTVPLWAQHFVRDTGLLGVVADAATIVTAGAALAARPAVLAKLVHASATARIGVSYGPLPQHRLDIFAAPSDAHEPPVVLFVHGGAWGSGSRLIYRLVGHRLSAEGFTCILVGYRRYPRASIDEQVDDVGLALRWAAESAEFGGRPRHLWGHSSGAHVCAMSVLRRAQTRQAPLCDSFTGVAGVYNIASHFEFERGRGVHEVSPMKPAAGGPAGFASASPATIASQLLADQAVLLPHVLLVHGTDDSTVPYESSVRMAEALRGAGVREVECVVLLEKGHADFMLELSGLVAERSFAQLANPEMVHVSGQAASAVGGMAMRTIDPILELMHRSASERQTGPSSSPGPRRSKL